MEQCFLSRKQTVGEAWNWICRSKVQNVGRLATTTPTNHRQGNLNWLDGHLKIDHVFSFSCSCVPLLKSPYWISSKQGQRLKPRITKQELEHYVREKYYRRNSKIVTHHYTKTKQICFLVCDFIGKLPTRNKLDFMIMPKKKNKKNNYKKPKTWINIGREFNSKLMVSIVHRCLGCGVQRKCQTIRDSQTKSDSMGVKQNTKTFKSRLSLIVRVNVVLNRTVVVDSDWRFDNLCGSHLQSQSELYHVSWWYYTLVVDLIG